MSSSAALFVQGSSSLSADLNLQDNKLSQIRSSGLPAFMCARRHRGSPVPGGLCYF